MIPIEASHELEDLKIELTDIINQLRSPNITTREAFWKVYGFRRKLGYVVRGLDQSMSMTSWYEDGKFWIIDSVTGRKMENFSPFDTLKQARDAIGDQWTDSTSDQDANLDL